MARRRLMTILATTCVAGMVGAPALADPLELVTEPVEQAVTEVVGDTTDTVTDATATDAPLDTVTEPVEEVVDTDLEVEVAPSDEDGSPQVEVDGGVTVGGQEVDLGGATDPVEEAIDPDPAPSPSSSSPTGTSSDGERRAAPTASDGPGGLLPGGGVVAAGEDTRPAGSDAGRSSASSARAGAGFDLDGIGVTRFGGGTADVDRVPDPEVAPPLADGADVLEAPTVLDPETPAVLAGGATAEDGNVVTALLRALAAALVLGTGAAWTRRAAPAVTRAG